MLTERFEDALAYAARLHRDQRRKGVDIPYISHLLAVAALVTEHGGDEDQAIAALLHDAVEDQGGMPRADEIGARFGAGVRAIVLDCTDTALDPKPAWEARKRAYLATLEHKPDRSLLVSLADKLHNATAIRRDFDVCGATVWSRFTGGREGSLWYYRALSDVFMRRCPGVMANDLSATVANLEARA